MMLVIGGTYQGKLDYVLQSCKDRAEQVYTCSQDCTAVPPPKKIVYHFERWILACVQESSDPEKKIAGYLDTLTDEIIICDDISCGIVPVDPKLRQWRETVGRTLTVLSLRADKVVRLFCGIPMIIKGDEKDEIKN